MNKFTALTILMFSLAAAANAHAEYLYKGTDISPMIEFYRSQVHVLTKAVTAYNWTSGAHEVSDWFKDPAHEVPQGDEKMLELGRKLSLDFWKYYGSDVGKNNMYGIGLYAAVDPVTTFSYGMGEGGWRMIQVRFPVGTRLLDFAFYNLEVNQRSDAAMKIQSKFGCPSATSAESFFSSGGSGLTPSCRDLIHEVFANGLQVDALAYGYDGTKFQACMNSGMSPRAFVLLGPNFIKTPETIHIYTAATRENLDERIRIQTLFLTSTTQGANDLAVFQYILAAHFDQYPDRDIKSSKTVCEGVNCVITVTFCDQNNVCDSLPLPPIARSGGGEITRAEASQSQLLWDDLIGKAKSKTTTTWLKGNRFGCTGELPYKK